MSKLLTPVNIIPEQTAAVTAVAAHPVYAEMVPATLIATNLAGSESVAVLFSVDGGITFEPLAQDGADLTLTATQNTFNMTSPLLLGVTKSSTAAACGVFLQAANDTPRLQIT